MGGVFDEENASVGPGSAGEPGRPAGGTTAAPLPFSTERWVEADLALATDPLPFLIAYVDADERYRFINRAFEAWCGRPRAEVVGCRVRDVVNPDTYATIAPHLAAALAGETVTFESKVPCQPAGERSLRASRL